MNSPITCPKLDYVYEARLASVVDGDTLKLDINLGFNQWVHGQWVRLLEVYAPELRGGTPQTKVQAKMVKDALEGIFAIGKTILVQTFKTDSRDVYGRYLAVVWVDEVNLNQFINDYMVAQKIVPGGKGVKNTLQ